MSKEKTFNRIGVGVPRDFRDGLRCGHAHLALKAVELGNGLAPASNVPAGDALQDEPLIAPFTGKISTGRGCHLVQSQAPEVRARRRPFTEGIVSMSVRR